MSLLSGIYDSQPIQPIAKIKENLSIWTNGKYSHARIKYLEPLPRSSPMVIEMVTASGAATIAANGTIGKQIVAILQLADNEFFHLRWEPLDDMEGVLWEQASQGRFAARAVHARVNSFTAFRDPYLSTTTFFILGRNRDMNLEVRNPNPVALPQARFVFWGFRYLLEALSSAEASEIAAGRRATTWVPAEGLSA